MVTLAWFRGRDLRVADQPILAGGAVIPVFCLEPELLDAQAAPFRAPLLIRHLQSLREDLRGLGSDLLLLEGRAEQCLPELVRRCAATGVRVLRSVEPGWADREAALAESLAPLGCTLEVLEGDTLVAPGALLTATGTPFRVFTPFARAFHRQARVAAPTPAPGALAPWPENLAGHPWPWPGAAPAETALARLEAFAKGALHGYGRGRDQLGEAGTSRLSADLAFGTLSVRQVWSAVHDRLGGDFDGDIESYLNELLWREFAHHTLGERPELLQAPFREGWRGFPWRDAPADLAAWQEGRTGYPVVDAAARELLATGHVHNRARMIAASFLTKHLLIDWRLGEAHYRRLLADYDPASNVMGWQWCAGCGVDAQPWFRIFNPEAQAKRFDPQGAYVRRWAPARLAPPIIPLALGRSRFLAAAKGHLG